MPTINNPVNNFARMQQVNATKAPVAFRESQPQLQETPEQSTGMKTSTKVIIGSTLLALGALATAYYKSPAVAAKINSATSAVLSKTKEAASVVSSKTKSLWNTAVQFVKDIPAKFKSKPST